jgi:glycosyltransferase A (GT-A) superfamily protein (DUF2064 family)
MTGTLLVIAKAPRAGHSKTRLCPPCTPQQAADLAEAALADTLDAVLAATRAQRHVLVLDGEPGPWLPDGFEVIAQRGDGLAERLANGFADAGSGGVLVGMDTPQLTPDLLDTALLALEQHGSAFGAASDGGWWGIGLPAADLPVFDGVPMSSPFTGAWQRARLRAAGLDPHELPVLRDVDTIADALTVAAEAPHTRFARRLGTLQAVAA